MCLELLSEFVEKNFVSMVSILQPLAAGRTHWLKRFAPLLKETQHVKRSLYQLAGFSVKLYHLLEIN
jgi:hypothetical protein